MVKTRDKAQEDAVALGQEQCEEDEAEPHPHTQTR